LDILANAVLGLWNHFGTGFGTGSKPVTARVIAVFVLMFWNFEK
jgi:hypothetical protein